MQIASSGENEMSIEIWEYLWVDFAYLVDFILLQGEDYRRSRQKVIIVLVLQASVQKLLDLDLFQLCLHLGQFHGMAEHRKTYIVKQTLRCMAICTEHHTDLKRQRTIWSQVTASLNNPEKTLRQRFAPTDMRYGSAILKIYWSTWLWVFEITAVEYPLPRDMNLSNLLESRSAIAVGRRNRCSRDCGQSSQGTSETEICWGTEVLHLATCIELTYKSTYVWITCITKRGTYVVKCCKWMQMVYYLQDWEEGFATVNTSDQHSLDTQPWLAPVRGLET